MVLQEGKMLWGTNWEDSDDSLKRWQLRWTLKNGSDFIGRDWKLSGGRQGNTGRFSVGWTFQLGGRKYLAHAEEQWKISLKGWVGVKLYEVLNFLKEVVDEFTRKWRDNSKLLIRGRIR